MLHRQNLLRSIVTLLVILVIVGGIYGLWLRYQVEPVTRDGKVRADMVPVAADVSGLVTEVKVGDNQIVKKGDILFVIDRPRYQLALQQAAANVASQQAALAQAIREDRRNQALANGVKQAQAQGAKVSLADWVFADWDPTKPYQNKSA